MDLKLSVDMMKKLLMMVEFDLDWVVVVGGGAVLLVASVVRVVATAATACDRVASNHQQTPIFRDGWA